MKLSGTVLVSLVAVISGFKFEIEEIDMDSQQIRLKNNGWMDFDEVDIEIELDQFDLESEVLSGIVIEEKEQYIKGLQILEQREADLRNRESALHQEMDTYAYNRKIEEERFAQDLRRFDTYVSHTLYNLNTVLENLKKVDEMKKPTEEYLKFEKNTFKKAKGGQL